MLSEEEKKAIEYWKRDIEFYHLNTQLASEHYAQMILNLMEKLQNEIEEKSTIIMAGTEKVKQLEKEIEKLKIIKLNFENWKEDYKELLEATKQNKKVNVYVDVPRDFQEQFISKDKIRELREIDNIDLIQFKIKKLLEEN